MIDILIWMCMHPGIYIALEREAYFSYQGGVLKVTMVSEKSLNRAKACRKVSLEDLAMIKAEAQKDFVCALLDGMYEDMLSAEKLEYEKLIESLEKERSNERGNQS